MRFWVRLGQKGFMNEIVKGLEGLHSTVEMSVRIAREVEYLRALNDVLKALMAAENHAGVATVREVYRKKEEKKNGCN